MVIDLIDGTILRTPLQRVRRRRSGAVINDGGTWLLREPYDHLLSDLRSRLIPGAPTRSVPTRALVSSAGEASKPRRDHKLDLDRAEIAQMLSARAAVTLARTW